MFDVIYYALRTQRAVCIKAADVIPSRHIYMAPCHHVVLWAVDMSILRGELLYGIVITSAGSDSLVVSLIGRHDSAIGITFFHEDSLLKRVGCVVHITRGY